MTAMMTVSGRSTIRRFGRAEAFLSKNRAIAHPPTGLAEFPQVRESDLLKKMETMGVKVLEFAKVTGQDPPAGGAPTAAGA